VADLDLARAKLGGEPAGFVRGFLPEPGVPDWSPDGRRLAYQACSGGSCIAIRTVDTGEVRQVPQSALLYPSDPRWSPDGALLLTSARDTRGRNGLFTVNVETGETSFIVSVPRFGVSPLWSADGKKIYYLNNGVAVVERDLSSGMERDLVKAGVPEECRSRPMDDISR
jgi:Tol biopolymer transport system component